MNNYNDYPSMVNYSGYTARQAFKSVGKGWWPLVKEAIRAKPKDVKIVQVKEKFAALRIYHEPYNEEYQLVLNKLERASAATCEWCGKKGTLDRRYYWILTLCPGCKKKRKLQKEQKNG